MIYQLLLLLGAIVAAASGALRKVEIDYGPPQPYQFGYKVKDSKNGDQWRTESKDGQGKVTGTYGYYDPNGFHRQVDYVADERGFRVKVRSNEPGLDSQGPANVELRAKPPQLYFDFKGKKPSTNLDIDGHYSFLHKGASSEKDIVILEGDSSQTPWYPMDTIVASL